MGNWSVFKPESIRLHMHIFGRSKNAKVQKYGHAVQLPFRDTGFYDKFQKLNANYITLLKAKIDALLKIKKYIGLLI